MKQLVFILIAFIALATFIRAFDGGGGVEAATLSSLTVSEDVAEK